MKAVNIPLGSEVKDKVTGFRGIITSKSEHLTGCTHYWVQPPASADGKIPDSQAFDGNRLEITGKGVSESFTDEMRAQTNHPEGPTTLGAHC